MDQLLFATIHLLQKHAGERRVQVTLREDVLDTDSPPVVQLATQLSALVGKNESTVYWGQFGSRRREGQFPESVAGYAQLADEASFKAMAEVAMTELEDIASRSNFATGGYMFFAHYLAAGTPFLLVAMMKERGAIRLTDALEPEAISEIDLSKLHQAARVNLNRYVQERQRAAEPTLEDVEKTYLCFVNKQGRDEIATYFVEALGCEKGISTARTTNEVVKAVKTFFLSKPQIATKAPEARRAVIDFLQGRDDNSVVTLDQVIGAVGTVLQADEYAHLEGLKETLNGDDHQVPETFSISHKALKKFTQVNAKADHWQLRFESAALGVEEGEIVFDPQSHTLTLTQLPTDTVQKVQAILRERRQLEAE